MRGFAAILFLFLATWRVEIWRSGLERSALTCGYLEKGGLALVTGTAVPAFGGRWELWEPRIDWGQGARKFAGRVVLLRAPGLDFGRKVRISGRFRCQRIRRNPGRMEDGLWNFFSPTVYIGYGVKNLLVTREQTGAISRMAIRIDRYLSGLFYSRPGLQAWVRAVWCGDQHGLPLPLQELYRDGGLLHVLALSGQHVGIAVLMSLGLWRVFLLIGQIKRLRYLELALPIGVAMVLWLTGKGCPSIQRTLALTVVVVITRLCRWSCSPWQMGCSAIAFCLIWNPSLVAKPGFILSAGMAAVLVQIAMMSPWKRMWRQYLFITAVMPILAMPLTAFFFGEVAPLAPVANLLLSWLWGLVLIPVGFMLPLFAIVLPESWISGLESFWWWVIDLHQIFSWIRGSSQFSVRPTIVELLLIEIGLVWLLIRCGRGDGPLGKIPLNMMR